MREREREKEREGRRERKRGRWRKREREGGGERGRVTEEKVQSSMVIIVTRHNIHIYALKNGEN